jgi:hypothetical protein
LKGCTERLRINYKSAGAEERAGTQITENTAFSHGYFVGGYRGDANFKTAAKSRDYADCDRKKNIT